MEMVSRYGFFARLRSTSDFRVAAEILGVQVVSAA